MGHEQTGLYFFLPTQVCISTARVRAALSDNKGMLKQMSL
jgi:hypothetical protein